MTFTTKWQFPVGNRGDSWSVPQKGFMANCWRASQPATGMFVTSCWGGGSWPTAQGGLLAATMGGFMDSPSHRVHGWLLGRGSQPVASRYSDELALFIIVIKTLVAGDQLFWRCHLACLWIFCSAVTCVWSWLIWNHETVCYDVTVCLLP